MFFKISTPEKIIFEWEVTKAIIPTEAWEVCISYWHNPVSSIVEPWIIRFVVKDKQHDEFVKWTEFLFEQDKINVSVWKWLMYVDWNKIILLVSTVTIKPVNDKQALEEMKIELEKQIKNLKSKWSLDELEKSFISLQKIKADLKLHNIIK